jgi:hypothetical protein
MLLGASGLAALVLKAGGYGVVTSFACTILEKLGQPEVSKLLHIAAWIALGIFSIDLLMNHCQMVLFKWGGHYW